MLRHARRDGSEIQKAEAASNAKQSRLFNSQEGVCVVKEPEDGVGAARRNLRAIKRFKGIILGRTNQQYQRYAIVHVGKRRKEPNLEAAQG